MPQHSLLPDAQKLVDEWTKGLLIIAQLHVDASMFFVITKDLQIDAPYSVLRFFKIAETWHVSMDADSVTADEAFATLARTM